MAQELTDTLYTWLRSCDLAISRSYLEAQLETHPYYPSLASITDILDELGIENLSMITNVDQLAELPVPFLAHSGGTANRFILIRNLEKQVIGNEIFTRDWDGVVMLLEKPQHWLHSGNEIARKKERKNFTQIAISSITLFVLLSAVVWINTSFYIAAFTIAALGFVLAILAVQKELGIRSELTDQICGSSGCDGVKKGKRRPAALPGWGDAGVIYFAALLLLQLMNVSLAVLGIVAVASAPFIIYSLYHQWLVAKHWCRLCLAVLLILAAQVIIYAPVVLSAQLELLPGAILLTVATFSVTSFIWLMLMKPVLQKQQQYYKQLLSLLRLKNDPIVFNSLVVQQPAIRAGTLVGDLQLGDASASQQVLVICNPFCRPCASTHHQLHELLESVNIGVTVRFMVNPSHSDQQGMAVVSYILQLITGKPADYKRKVLQHWYEMMDLERFCKAYSLSLRVDAAAVVGEMYDWCVRQDIRYTPTIFLNGHELPSAYAAADLKNLFLRNNVMRAAGAMHAIA